MTEPLPEPLEPTFLQADRAGTTFLAGPGWIAMSDAAGTQVGPMWLVGEQAYPLNPLDLGAALSIATGEQVGIAPLVETGVEVQRQPTRIRTVFRTYKLREAVEEAGRLLAGLARERAEGRTEEQDVVNWMMERYTNRPIDRIPRGERARVHAGLRRLLADPDALRAMLDALGEPGTPA